MVSGNWERRYARVWGDIWSYQWQVFSSIVQALDAHLARFIKEPTCLVYPLQRQVYRKIPMKPGLCFFSCFIDEETQGSNFAFCRLRLGMMFFSTSFFWLVSSPIQGALIGIEGSFWPVCVFSGSTVILGVFFMLFSRFLVRKENHTWKVWLYIDGKSGSFGFLVFWAERKKECTRTKVICDIV